MILVSMHTNKRDVDAREVGIEGIADFIPKR
jgi:hypothetical protein